MSQKTPRPVSPSVPVQHPTPPQPTSQTRPTEPREVLGRHKNAGQKDHKGAR